jgi:hypothetical protein
MTKSEMIRIARIAIDKGLDYETLKYSDYLYNEEDSVDEVYEYVDECKRIGTTAFNAKYPLESA